MLFFFHGSDRDKARLAFNKAVEKKRKRADVVRITDAHTAADLSAALSGPGMFGPDDGRLVVFDSILGGENKDMRAMLLDSLSGIKASEEHFFMLEGALDAATRKQVEKYAEETEKFDLPKKAEEKGIFVLANALERGDRKALWVGLMREFEKGTVPEAIHGLLFWGAKKMLMNARAPAERARREALVAKLAELPHESRRKGVELEYALERFALSKT